MKLLNLPHILGQLNFKIIFAKQTWNKKLSYIGPSIWNSLPDSIKKAKSLNTFKYNVKKHYLTWIT